MFIKTHSIHQKKKGGNINVGSKNENEQYGKDYAGMLNDTILTQAQYSNLINGLLGADNVQKIISENHIKDINDIINNLKIRVYNNNVIVSAQLVDRNGTIIAIPDKTSGTDGSITWNFANGVLSISGTGSIGGTDGYEKGSAPWSHLADKITSVSIADGITSIGANAFYNLAKVNTVTIPSTVTAINNGAFENCALLGALNLPANLTGIGTNSFKNCESIQTITVPDKVTSIGEGAFDGCNLVKEITLPFVGSSRGNTAHTFAYIFGGNVPNTLEKVTITNETKIPDNAFKNLNYIESITINNDVNSIGASAFEGCAALKAFTIPTKVTAIGDNTFKGCEKAVTITVPDTVTDIGEGAFDGCASLREVNIPSEVIVINDYTFRGCESLRKIEIPVSVEHIGEGVLEGCTKLVNIKVPFVGSSLTAEEGKSNFGYLFGLSDNKEIPPAVTRVEITSTDRSAYIPEEAFKDCGNVVDIIIDGGRSVLDNAFVNCKNLRNLYIPKSVANIGSQILMNCTRLETLTVPFIGKNKEDKNTETSVLGGFFGYNDKMTGQTTMQYYNTRYHCLHLLL